MQNSTIKTVSKIWYIYTKLFVTDEDVIVKANFISLYLNFGIEGKVKCHHIPIKHMVWKIVLILSL